MLKKRFKSSSESCLAGKEWKSSAFMASNSTSDGAASACMFDVAVAAVVK